MRKLQLYCHSEYQLRLLGLGGGGEILKREEYMGAFNSSAQERDLRA